MSTLQAESLVTSFAMKWLELNSSRPCGSPLQAIFDFNATLRKDFVTEACAVPGSVLLQKRM